MRSFSLVRITRVEWDRANRRHFSDRGRTRVAEVMDVLLARCHPARAVDLVVAEEAEPRRAVFGRTCGGPYLMVIVSPKAGGVVRPITAWPLSDRDIQSYLAWRRTVKR